VGLNAATLTAVSQLSNGVPKGYLRVLVFNQDSVLVDQRKLQLTQDALGHYQVLSDTLSIRRNGYVTVYVGNESPVDVYFDELRIEYYQGLQVQETQYDPAGLELAGLVAPSPGIRGLNNYRFNGKEFQADLGLAWNHQDWRFFDPQLLRWHAGDPELENGQESWTPYSFSYDNAIRYSDADGRCPNCPDAGIIQSAWASGVAAWESVPQGGGTISYGLAAAAAGTAILVTTVVLTWDKLPSRDQLNKGLSGMRIGARNSASFGYTYGYGQMPDPSVQNGRVNASGGNKTGSKGGPTAGKVFGKKRNDATKAENISRKGNFQCEDCGLPLKDAKQSKRGVTPDKDEVRYDHIYPRSMGGNAEDENRQALCVGCNGKKSDTPPADYYGHGQPPKQVK
jgi:RHS repeat-associated protein